MSLQYAKIRLVTRPNFKRSYNISTYMPFSRINTFLYETNFEFEMANAVLPIVWSKTFTKQHRTDLLVELYYPKLFIAEFFSTHKYISVCGIFWYGQNFETPQFSRMDILCGLMCFSYSIYLKIPQIPNFIRPTDCQ
jgi:hypothetical protein